MDEQREQHDRIRELADEFRLKAHLAGMEAKTLWEDEVQPRLKDLDRKFDEATKDVDFSDELNAVERKLRKLVDDLIESA